VIFSAMAFVYFTFGVMVASIPAMVSTVRDDLGISRTAMGLALGAWALIYIVSAPLAGRLVDRIGLRNSIAIGALTIAISGFARAGAQNLVTLWLAVAIFGVGGPLVSASAPKLIAVWFGDATERRLAVGLYTASPALGGMASLLLTNSVMLPWLGDWRGVLVAYAVLALVGAAVWTVVATMAPPSPQSDRTPNVKGSGDWRKLLASPGVRLALVLGISSFFVNHALASWLPNILETDAGLSASAASTWVGVASGVGIIASLTVPRFAGPQRRAATMATVMAVMAVSLVVIAFGSQAAAVAAVLSLGVRAALVPLVIVILMEAEDVTPTNMGLANGLWFAFAEVGGAAGPLVVGAISDTSAGFGAAMLLMAGMLVGMIVITLSWTGERRDLASAS
jgi:cyanate permease